MPDNVELSLSIPVIVIAVIIVLGSAIMILLLHKKGSGSYRFFHAVWIISFVVLFALVLRWWWTGVSFAAIIADPGLLIAAVLIGAGIVLGAIGSLLGKR